MPNLDRTGPKGQGPMTGGRRGRCRNLQSQNIQTARQTGEIKKVPGVGRGGKPRGGSLRKGQGRRSGN